MRSAALSLIAVIGACHFSPFDNLTYAELTDVKVSPSVVRAGDQFVASANVVFHGSCTAASTTVTYEVTPIGTGVTQVTQVGTAISQSFTAALDGTLVRFAAYCTAPIHQNFLQGPGGADDLRDITIRVLPAP